MRKKRKKKSGENKSKGQIINKRNMECATGKKTKKTSAATRKKNITDIKQKKKKKKHKFQETLNKMKREDKERRN